MTAVEIAAIAAVAMAGAAALRWFLTGARREQAQPERRVRDDALPPLNLSAFKVPPQVPIPAPLETKPVKLPAADEPGDDTQQVAAVEAWIGQTIMIEYTDANGDDSRRRVTIRAVTLSASGTLMLRCWCHERDAWRHFRMDRISAVIDLRTGEVFEDVQGFFESELGSVAPEQPERPTTEQPEAPRSSPAIRPTKKHGAARQALQPFLPEIATLVFLARADGKFRAVEKTVIGDYAIARCPSVAGHRKWLEGYLGRMSPDRDEINKMLSMLPMNDREQMQQLLQSLAQIAAADGAIGDREHDFIAQFSQEVERRALYQ